MDKRTTSHRIQSYALSKGTIVMDVRVSFSRVMPLLYFNFLMFFGFQKITCERKVMCGMPFQHFLLKLLQDNFNI